LAAMGLAEKSGHAELEECAQKAKYLRAEKARKERKKKPHGKRKEAPKAGGASAGGGAEEPRRPRALKRKSTIVQLVEHSCSDEMKPVWISSISFFIAGALDDAVVYAFPPEDLGRANHCLLLLLDAVLVHAYCTCVCRFVETKRTLDASERALLKNPMNVLCGWMWKSAIVGPPASPEKNSPRPFPPP